MIKKRQIALNLESLVTRQNFVECEKVLSSAGNLDPHDKKQTPGANTSSQHKRGDVKQKKPFKKHSYMATEEFMEQESFFF